MFLATVLTFSCFICTHSSDETVWVTWANSPPDNIPFNQSSDILSWSYLNFSGNYEYGGAYIAADTWYPTWNEDDTMFTPFTDGTVYINQIVNKSSNASIIWNNYTISSNSGGFNQGSSTVGHATVIGGIKYNYNQSNRQTDSLNITLINGGTFESSTLPYLGRYPGGSFSYNNIWYYATYALNKTDECQGWCILGPFIGFRWSNDSGKTWIEPRIIMKNKTDTIFKEPLESNFNKIKYGAPHVVDFGKNLEYSSIVDTRIRNSNNNTKNNSNNLNSDNFNNSKVYIIGHGTNIGSNSVQGWIQGDQIYIARCDPTIDCINNYSKWQFFKSYNLTKQSKTTTTTTATTTNSTSIAATSINIDTTNGDTDADADDASDNDNNVDINIEWVYGDVSSSEPLFTWINHTGVVTMTYIPVLKKFVMCITHPFNYQSKNFGDQGPFNTYFLESDFIVGPFKYITYMEKFGPQGYFVNIPSKFLDRKIIQVDDNNYYYEIYLSYSANYASPYRGNYNISNPIGSGYHWCLQKSRFKLSNQFVKQNRQRWQKENVKIVRL